MSHNTVLSTYFINKDKLKELLRKIITRARVNLNPLSALILLNIVEYQKSTLDFLIAVIEELGKQYDIIQPEVLLSKLSNRITEVGIKEQERELGTKIEESVGKSKYEKIDFSSRTLYDYFSTSKKIQVKETRITEEMEQKYEKTKVSKMEESIALGNYDKLKVDVKVKDLHAETVVKKKRDTALNFEIIRMPKKILIEDSIETFRNYFIDRYLRIRKILLKKGLENVISSRSLRLAKKGDYIIIMVRNKISSKSGYGIIIGEDLEGEAKILVPSNGVLAKKFKHVLLDSVIAVKISKVSSDYLIADDILFPDIPRIRERHRAHENIKIAFIADIHVGSKKFLKKEFENFINFMNGKIGNKRLRELAENIDGIIINGDLVDGVGIYPDQQAELEIVDIYKQYELLAEYLSKIPEDKLIIVVPGNHDAAGKFVPQPPIPKDVASELYKLSNIKVLGNPALIGIDNVKIMLYHGYGLENIAAYLGIGIDKPTKVLIEVMRTRHLLPEWGKIPVVPTIPDYLVIEEVPDILVVSHLHIADIRITGGGVLLLSTGAFQDLTSWQKQLGITPTPGIVPIVDLKTYEISLIECNRSGCRILH